jgi:hypothetical protein
VPSRLTALGFGCDNDPLSEHSSQRPRRAVCSFAARRSDLGCDNDPLSEAFRSASTSRGPLLRTALGFGCDNDRAAFFWKFALACDATPVALVEPIARSVGICDCYRLSVSCS